MTRERDGIFVWVTWLSRLMAGEISCEWAPWFRSHYQDYTKAPSDFDQAEWLIQHTRQLRELRSQRQALGEQVLTENQARFYWKRPRTGLTVGGRPDLVGIGDESVTVFDVKTGQPRGSDSIQVMIYMYFLPTVAPVYRQRPMRGEVVYRAHRRMVELTPDFEEQINYFLDILDSSEAPLRVPSAEECRFCDISKEDCSDRIEMSTEGVTSDDEPDDAPFE